MSRKAKPREWCGTHAHRLTAELRSAAYGYKTDTLTHYTDCGLFCMFLQFSPFAFFRQGRELRTAVCKPFSLIYCPIMVILEFKVKSIELKNIRNISKKS
jgi:hypothetical protein